jgi:hypothetical protein
MKEKLCDLSVWLGLKITYIGDWFFNLGWNHSQAELDAAEDTPEEYRSNRQIKHLAYLEAEGFTDSHLD